MVIPKVAYGMLAWETCSQNKFGKIEKQHFRATKLVKNIPRTIESNRVLEIEQVGTPLSTDTRGR